VDKIAGERCSSHTTDDVATTGILDATEPDFT